MIYVNSNLELSILNTVFILTKFKNSAALTAKKEKIESNLNFKMPGGYISEILKFINKYIILILIILIIILIVIFIKNNKFFKINQ